MNIVRSRTCRVAAAVLCSALGLVACGDELAPVAEDETEAVACEAEGASAVFPALPIRPGPSAVTTGTVPHQQLNPDSNPDAIAELHAQVFELTDVVSRPSTIVDGATAIWLRNEFNLGKPECVIRERELGHIHVDGSLHVTMPLARISSAVDAGWVERHPWAATRVGFEAYVMIFSPRDSGEVDLIVDLVAEGIEFVDGG